MTPMIVEHPLLQHKLSILRNKQTGTKEFRDLVGEIATLLCYEATRDLPLEEVEIETPIAVAKTRMLSGRKLALVPILRAGLGMVVRAGATTGGTDMAAMIVHEHLSMFTVPMVLFTIDGIVVVVAALNFGVQAGLFALIALFVSTKTMDSVIKGFNTAMQFLIISPNQEEIVRRIHTEMDRGCTRLEATGTYEGRKNGALLCVVPRMEASRLKKIVSECDAHAFVTVCDVHEALGEGFSYRHIS